MQRLVGDLGWLAALVVSLTAACGGDSTTRINVGGESHFLVHCSVGNTCAGGLDCIGGVCTLDCSAGEAICSELSPLATCGFQSSEPDARAVCDVGCSEDAACAALGDEYRCESGDCRAGLTPSADSALGIGTPLPPAGGSTPSPGADVGAGEGSLPGRALCASQPVPASSEIPADGEWWASTQADIDALEGCEELPFNVLIASNSELVLDLRPLYALRVVTGHFSISSVQSLEGLEQLRRAGGLALSVGASSLSTLANLESVGPRLDDGWGGLFIIGCEGLEDLSGLDSLTGVQDLVIRRNSNLHSLDGLLLPTAMNSVVIAETPALLDLGSVSALESVVTLELYGNEALEALELSALRNVRAPTPPAETLETSDAAEPRPGIFVALNPRLENVALPVLETASSVIIQRNESLLSVELAALSEVSRLVIGLNLALFPDAIILDGSLSADLMRVGGNGPATGAVFSAYAAQSFLDPCPFVNDGHCDFCIAQILGTGGLLGTICREELCATETVDCGL